MNSLLSFFLFLSHLGLYKGLVLYLMATYKSQGTDLASRRKGKKPKVGQNDGLPILMSLLLFLVVTIYSLSVHLFCLGLVYAACPLANDSAYISLDPPPPPLDASIDIRRPQYTYIKYRILEVTNTGPLNASNWTNGKIFQRTLVR